MYRFLQKHGKKLMAVFSIFLMIAFALPSAYKYAGAGRDQVIGRINGAGGAGGDIKLSSVDLYNAKRNWETLTHLPWRENTPQIMRLGPDAVAQINQHPLMFLLLQKEAERMGVTVSKDQLASDMVNTPGLATLDEDKKIVAERALSDLLLVIQGFQRGASAIKISDPMVKRELAELGQTITVNVVDFPAASYVKQVPPPTADQLKAQFEKYGDVIKGTASSSNPFGFGYKYPNRLKLQYIMVPRTEVRKAVEAAKTPYEWRVEAQKYYMQHQKEFEAAPAGKAYSLDVPTTKPTTQPFALVEDKIKGQLIDAETEKRMKLIEDRINTTMAEDWVAYHNTPAGATTKPSKLRVAYDSFEYLQKLAATIQNDFKVQPTVVSLADKWLSADDLSKLPGIGIAVAELDVGEVALPRYLMARTAAFAPAERREDSGMLQVLEPTRRLSDSNQALYVARVSAADPIRPPATLAEVEPAVKTDLTTAAAYELAKAEAQKFVEQARQKGLKEAAVAAGGKGVVAVGPLSNRTDQAVPALAIPLGPGANQFIGGAFDLLSTPASRPSGKPVSAIELPRDGRIIVAELANVDATFTQRSLPFETAQVLALLTGKLQEDFLRLWFSYTSLTSRLNFVPDPSYKESESPSAPPPAVPPLF